ncbi:histone acetyltransferase type B catalytic subunit [Asbolus verrucosus]|uniref:histone acetyltransferase n=1 Tax=Asbolus verrucosus TaxID=1661398 RepID=A0A482VDP6_ASBVE|nr:histone acetyltransferase type B catalytic subunit [Asbolus verrucosus]
MADKKLCEDNELVASCEDEEMMTYKKSSLNVVSFRIVREENDLEIPTKKSNSFKPDMAHQIFGESEMIFGYRQLSIGLYYLHNSAKCYVDVQFSDQIPESDLCKADDIMKALNPWLPENYRVERDDFKKDIREENHTTIFGEVIDTFEVENSNFKITICDMKNADFKEFHQRFETFIVWYIDGANFIDLEDSRWTIFYVYEEYSNPNTNKKYCSPVAFCTVYKFYLYPNSIRPRISQFFVLPTHQKRGIGTNLYSTVFKHLKALPDAEDITVEEPTPVFQKLRDFCDSLYIYRDLEENKINISTQNHKQINAYLRKHKICKRQAQRVFDILECLTTHKNGYREYVKFTESIKARIASEVDKESRGSKRLCNLERTGIMTEPIDKKASVNAEFNKYIDSLERPVSRLRSHLAKIEANK